MNYSIKTLEKISEDGIEIKQLLTLEVTYETLDEEGSNLTSLHGKEISLEADPNEEAITFAAELNMILTEPKEVIKENLPIEEPNIDSEDIQEKIDELLDGQNNNTP